MNKELTNIIENIYGKQLPNKEEIIKMNDNEKNDLYEKQKKIINIFQNNSILEIQIYLKKLQDFKFLLNNIEKENIKKQESLTPTKKNLNFIETKEKIHELLENINKTPTKMKVKPKFK